MIFHAIRRTLYPHAVALDGIVLPKEFVLLYHQRLAARSLGEAALINYGSPIIVPVSATVRKLLVVALSMQQGQDISNDDLHARVLSVQLRVHQPC